MALDFGILLATVAMVSWGVADFLSKKAIDNIGFKTSIIINQSISFTAIFILTVFFFKLPIFTPELIGITILSGVTGVLGLIFLFRGFSKGNVSIVAPITASWSVITVLLAWVLFSEALTAVQIVGIVVVFLGVFFASTNFVELKKSINGGGWSAGALDAVLAMIAWGISYALVEPITSAFGPIMALFFLKVLSVAVLVSWTGVTKAKITMPKALIFALIAAAGLLDFCGYLTFNFSLGTQYVSIASAIVATAPAVTIGLAYVFLKEKMVTNQKLGILAILVGLVLIALT